MSGAESTNLSLTPSFLRSVASEVDLHDRFELMLQWAVRDEQIENIAHAAECEVSSGRKAGNLLVDLLATALAAHVQARYSSHRGELREYRGRMSTYQLCSTNDFIEGIWERI
jgi:hypothetical protein